MRNVAVGDGVGSSARRPPTYGPREPFIEPPQPDTTLTPEDGRGGVIPGKEKPEAPKPTTSQEPNVLYGGFTPDILADRDEEETEEEDSGASGGNNDNGGVIDNDGNPAGVELRALDFGPLFHTTGIAIGQAVDITAKSQVSFPLTITLTYPAAEPRFKGATQELIGVYYYNPTSGTWQQDGITLVSHDVSECKVTFKTTHLTVFRLGIPRGTTPTIAHVRPNEAVTGAAVQINGHGFNPVAARNMLTAGGAYVSIAAGWDQAPNPHPLNDGGETIRLVSAEGVDLDAVTVAAAANGNAWVRLVDGDITSGFIEHSKLGALYSPGTQSNGRSFDLLPGGQARPPVAGDLVINEILLAPIPTYLGDANGDGETSAVGDEFVEIVNTRAEPLDLSYVQVVSGQGLLHAFPLGAVLPAQSAYVIFGVDAVQQPPHPAGPFGGTWFLPDTSTLGSARARLPQLAHLGTHFLQLTTERMTSNPVTFQALTPADPNLFGFVAVPEAFPVLEEVTLEHLIAADVDRDLDMDALVIREQRDPVLFLNDGGGRFQQQDSIVAPANLNTVIGAAFADITADGAAELFVGETDPSGSYTRLVVLTNAGGHFDVLTELGVQNPRTSFGPRAMAVGDVDGDADLDVVFALIGDGPIIFRNDGENAYTHNPVRDSIPQTMLVAPTGLALDDLDQDGDLDLVLIAGRAGLGSNASLQLFINDGQGQFSEATAGGLPWVTDDLHELMIGDVNGDGFLDIVVAGVAVPTTVFTNDGSAHFARRALDVRTVDAEAIALEDVDGDGDLDLLVATVFANDLYLNDGTGQLLYWGELPLEVPSRELLGTDADNDGDIDIVGLGEGLALAENTGASVNHRPMLETIGVQDVQEGELLTFIARATDADHDPLTLQAYLHTGEPLSTIGAGFEDQGNGRGLFSWTPTAGQGDPAGRLYLVRIIASDAQSSDEIIVSIRVFRDNHPPVLGPIAAVSVNELEAVAINLAAQASDPDGDTLSFGFTAVPAAAGASMANGVFNWVPDALAGDGPNGYKIYNLSFVVTDPAGASAEQETTITVYDLFAGGNHPPVFENLVHRQAVVGINLTFTVEVSDLDGDPVTVSVSGSLPTGATFDSATRVFSWTPTPDQVAQHLITLQATDGHATTTGSFYIQVLAAGSNFPPTIEMDREVTLQEGERLILPVIITDPEDDPLTVEVHSLPRGAQWLTPAETGIENTWQLEWLPDTNQRGIYVVTIEAHDGMLTTTAAVTIEVLNNVTNQPLYGENGWIAQDDLPTGTPFGAFDTMTQVALVPGASIGIDLGANTLAVVRSIKLFHVAAGIVLDAGDLALYVSADNVSYQVYSGAVQVTATENSLLLDGLEITERYVKVHRRPGSPAERTAIENALPDILQAQGEIRRDLGIYESFADLAGKAFLYFRENVNPAGLIPDRVYVYESGKTLPGDIYSTGAAGFWLATLPVAVERGWITYEEGQAYARTTLEKYLGIGTTPVASYKGFFYHFLNADGSAYEHFDGDGVSILDSSLLFVGALACEQYFDAEIADLAEQLVGNADWEAFYDHSKHMLRMWWSPQTGFERHLDYLNEGMIAYILASGSTTHPIQADDWLKRDGDAYYAFSHGSFGRVMNRYGRDGRPMLQTFFGSLFAYLYPGMFIDLQDQRDDFYFDWTENTREAIVANYRFAQDNDTVGYSPVFWGISASDGPDGYQGLYGTRPLDPGAGGPRHDGTITPYALAGALPYAADLAAPALVYLADLKVEGIPVLNRYGLRGAVNSRQGYVAPEYLGIDQGAFVLGMDGFLGGTVNGLIAQSPFIQRALAALNLNHKTEATLMPAGPRAEHTYMRIDATENLTQKIQVPQSVLNGSGLYTLELDPYGMDNAQGIRFVDVEVRVNGNLLKLVRFNDLRGDGVVDVESVYLPIDRALLQEENNTVELRWVRGERWLQLEIVRLHAPLPAANTWQVGEADGSADEFSPEREVDDSCYPHEGAASCERAVNAVDEARFDLLFSLQDIAHDRLLRIRTALTDGNKPVTVEVFVNNAVVGRMQLLPTQEATVSISGFYLNAGWNHVALRHANYPADGQWASWDVLSLEEADGATYFNVIARNVDDRRLSPVIHFGSVGPAGAVVPAQQYLEVFYDPGDPTFERITISTDNRNAPRFRFTGPAEASASGLVGERISSVAAPILWQVYPMYLPEPPLFTNTVEWGYVPDASEPNFWEEGAVNYRTLMFDERVLGERPTPGRLGDSPFMVYLVADLQGKPAQRYTTETLCVSLHQQ